MKNRLIPIIAALACTSAAGQVSHTLYYMESVPQTNILNPARQPRANKYISVPGANAYVAASTNLRPLDFFQKDGDKWLTPLNNGFDYDDLYDNYKKRLAIDANVNIGILNFGWRTSDGNYWTFSLSERVSADAALPADLLKIGDRGLPSGTVLDFATLGISAMAYSELAASYSYAFDDQWTFGARAKVLAGSAAAKMSNSKFSIRTGEDKWHVETDLEILTSFPLETTGCIKEDGTVEFDSVDVREFDEDRDLIKHLIPSLKNPGFGIDLGATYKFNDNIRFSASVTDLGFISWGRDVSRFKSDGDFDFYGINYNLDNPEHNDDFQNAVDDAVDSVLTNCQVTLNHSRFATGLRPSVYLGAEYTPVYFLSLGFLSHTKFHPTHRVNQDFNISATLNPYKFPASVTFGYTINTLGLSSASFGLAVRMGVLQFYAMTDYIPAKYNVYKTTDGDEIPAPHNISNVNVSVGLNLLFGSKGYRDRPMTQTSSIITE